MDALPTTANPAADLVEAGASVFREFALNHPMLFGLAFQRTARLGDAADRVETARWTALERLRARLGRLERSGRLGPRDVGQAAFEFHALCEGLATLELRGMMPPAHEEKIWRSALAALVSGFGTPAVVGAKGR